MLYKKWGFTLVETTITIVIMSLLIGLVFEIYVVIWRMAVFVQWQKQLHTEMIFVIQTIQNLVDDQDILLEWTGEREEEHGFEQRLWLSDDDYDYFLVNACDVWENQLCHLELQKQAKLPSGEDAIIPLTSTWDVHIEQFYVKVLPFVEQNGATSFEDKMHEGFWLFIDVQVPFYNENKRWFRVSQKIQNFFTMRKY